MKKKISTDNRLELGKKSFGGKTVPTGSCTRVPLISLRVVLFCTEHEESCTVMNEKPKNFKIFCTARYNILNTVVPTDTVHWYNVLHKCFCTAVHIVLQYILIWYKKPPREMLGYPMNSDIAGDVKRPTTHL